MSRPGGWLRGTTVRKGGTTNNSRSGTPGQVASTSNTIFGGGVKDPSGRTSEFFSMDDQCPVCRSDRYLNPKLRLLVSSCYHKMCESCIDRLFTLGPAPCPICTKVLRKLAFTPQTFEDLTVEKEVAVRRRMAKEFNKRKEDFMDLRSYNDYLEEVEDITFNLINEIDIPQTEARIAAYRAENAALIELNIQREEQNTQFLREQEEYDRQQREQRTLEARRQEAEEREERTTRERDLIDKLENSTKDASKLVAKSLADAHKRNSARNATQGIMSFQSNSRLLRSRAAQSTAIPDVPHVAIQDDWYGYHDKYEVKSSYYDPATDAVRRDKEGIMRAGGYLVEEAWERALRSAVAGLEIPPLQADGDIVMSVG